MNVDNGRAPSGQALVADQAASRLAPAGFDPSRIAEVMEEDGGFWKSCSGCHETNEGYETGFYPYSDAFKCYVGSGCEESGGIGVVWDNIDYEDYARWSIEREKIGESRKRHIQNLANSFCHILSQRLKTKTIGGQPGGNAYSYAEVPEWLLRQWLERITLLSRSLNDDTVAAEHPKGEDAQRLSGEAMPARAEGIAQPQSSPPPKPRRESVMLDIPFATRINQAAEELASAQSALDSLTVASIVNLDSDAIAAATTRREIAQGNFYCAVREAGIDLHTLRRAVEA